MGIIFPCEIVSWQVLPAVRKEMTRYLVNDKHIARKDVSKKLGITEAAVCQYLKSKRGSTYKFSKNNLEKIQKLADKLAESDTGFESMCFICKQFDSPQEMIKDADNAAKKSKR